MPTRLVRGVEGIETPAGKTGLGLPTLQEQQMDTYLRGRLVRLPGEDAVCKQCASKWQTFRRVKMGRDAADIVAQGTNHIYNY